MKRITFNRIGPIALAILCLFFLAKCNGTKQDVNHKNIDGPQKNTVTAETPKEPQEKTVAAEPGIQNDKKSMDVPIYAVLVYDETKSYDGLYDSISNYFRVCGTGDVIPVKDRNRLKLDPGSKCYSQKVMNDMVAINDGNKAPSFARVLNVDTESKKMIAITDLNDTVVVSTTDLKPIALEKLTAASVQTQMIRLEQKEAIKEIYRTKEVKTLTKHFDQN